MTRQHKSTWQRHERHVAAAVGGSRTGNTGTAGADVVTDFYSIECKSWRRLPAKVVAALQQAERTATHGRVAVAVLHEVGARHDGDLVVLRWRDFADLLIGSHDTDKRLAARVAALVQLSDASDEERAILAPDMGN
jgi:hypothetical protein